MRAVLAVLTLLCLSASPADAAGIQRIGVASDDGVTTWAGAVWYPCAAPTEIVTFRGVEMAGVRDCPPVGEALPLIVLSHGARGWFGGHHDTAAALADAGYVVAAITHPDRDRRRWRTERPAAVKLLIDHMLKAWPDHARLDPDRIGFFGFSRGAYTGLVLLGGRPNYWRLLRHCLLAWSDPMCKSPPGGEAEGDADRPDDAEPPERPYSRDPRIKAAVIAAPLGLVFSKDGLAQVTAPIQLWRPENDQLLRYPDHAEALYQTLPTKPDYRVVPNAGHFAIMAPCGAAMAERVPLICKDAPDFDRAAFHRAFNADVVAFFQKHLTGP